MQNGIDLGTLLARHLSSIMNDVLAQIMIVPNGDVKNEITRP
jgi:hypothetical protein